MTDFRHVRCLLAYSGGTVPDSNRIPYSPSTLYKIDGTQISYLLNKNIIVMHICQATNRR